MDIVERLRQDHLMNPNYPSRLEAANEIERLRGILDEITEACARYDYAYAAEVVEEWFDTKRPAECTCSLTRRAIVPEEHNDSCPVVSPESAPGSDDG